MSNFPDTSATLIAKIRNNRHGEDSAAWVRFWEVYQDAIRKFAAFKGGAANTDDIVMTVLGKLVEVLRSGQYTPDKGRFHSYLATMIVNEVRMVHRKEMARSADRHVPLDSPLTEGGDETTTVAEAMEAPAESPERLDEEWRRAVLESAVFHVLNKTALSERDRLVYKAYAQEGEDIAAVAKRFGISRNLVSQIKTRIEKRIVAVGRDMVAHEDDFNRFG